MRAAYLDASALVKLLRVEAESAELSRELGAWPERVSSELVAVEARCAARRTGDAWALDRADAALARVRMLPCSAAVRDRAGEGFSRPLRTLDAIHASTALRLRADLGVVFVYDRRLREVLEAEGMPVRAPAASA